MQRRAWNVFINIFPCFTNVTNLHVYCDGSSSTVDALSCSSFIGAILSAVRVERSMKKLGVTRNVVWFPNPLTSKSDWDPVYTERGCRILSQFVHRKRIKQGHIGRAERESRRNDCDKKFKANLARRGQLFQRGIFSQFQRTPRLLFRKLKKQNLLFYCLYRVSGSAILSAFLVLEQHSYLSVPPPPLWCNKDPHSSEKKDQGCRSNCWDYVFRLGLCYLYVFVFVLSICTYSDLSVISMCVCI